MRETTGSRRRAHVATGVALALAGVVVGSASPGPALAGGAPGSGSAYPSGYGSGREPASPPAYAIPQRPGWVDDRARPGFRDGSWGRGAGDRGFGYYGRGYGHGWGYHCGACHGAGSPSGPPPVFVPPQWIWNGWGWVLVPGSWR